MNYHAFVIFYVIYHMELMQLQSVIYTYSAGLKWYLSHFQDAFISIIPLLGIINYNLPSFYRRRTGKQAVCTLFFESRFTNWPCYSPQGVMQGPGLVRLGKPAAAHSRKISSTFCIAKCIQRHPDLQWQQIHPSSMCLATSYISCLPLQWHHRTNIMHAREPKILLRKDQFTIYKGRRELLVSPHSGCLQGQGRYLEPGLQSVWACDLAVTRQLRFSIHAVTETG